MSDAAAHVDYLNMLTRCAQRDAVAVCVMLSTMLVRQVFDESPGPDFVVVLLEPAGGSSLNRPTGPIQFIGRAVRTL